VPSGIVTLEEREKVSLTTGSMCVLAVQNCPVAVFVTVNFTSDPSPIFDI